MARPPRWKRDKLELDEKIRSLSQGYAVPEPKRETEVDGLRKVSREDLGPEIRKVADAK